MLSVLKALGWAVLTGVALGLLCSALWALPTATPHYY